MILYVGKKRLKAGKVLTGLRTADKETVIPIFGNTPNLPLAYVVGHEV
jgi:hypothetical protein